MKRIYNLHKDNLNTRSPDILIKMLYIYSYPIFKSHIFSSELKHLDTLIEEKLTNFEDKCLLILLFNRLNCSYTY